MVVGNPLFLAGNYTVQVKASNGPSFFHHFVVETDEDPRKIGEFRMLYAPEDVEYVQGRAHPFTLHAGDLQGLLVHINFISTLALVLANTPVFECIPSSMGKNPAKVKWFINGEPLVAETNGVHIENRGRRLILMNARHFFESDVHTTTVMCKATNSLNEITASAQLNTIGSCF